jgi:hypothetical protein
MTGLFLLACAGGAMVACGLAAVLRRQPKGGLLLFAAGNGTLAVWGMISGRAEWPVAAANLTVAVIAAWWWWWGRFRRRRQRAPRAYGAKSRARIAALTRRARETARPRPVRRPAPQGGLS